MCADAGFHANQARWYIGKPRFHLATRPLLPQHDGATRIVAHDVERVLADIDADHGDRGIGCLRHGVLLVFGAPCQLRLLAGQEHGRTIPLPDIDLPVQTRYTDPTLGVWSGNRNDGAFVTGACAAAGNLASLAFSEVAMLPYSSSAVPMGRNAGELRQPVMGMAKLFELRAARSSRCEESL